MLVLTLAPPGPVTVTSTVERFVPGGAVARICVGEKTVKSLAAASPKLTPVAPSRYCPEIVICVPPSTRLLDGLTPDTFGASTTSAL